MYSRKLLYISSLLLAVGIIFSACKDNLLNQKPLDRISEAQYWSSANDAKLYVNQFYETFSQKVSGGAGLWKSDGGTDIHILQNYSKRLAGTRTVPTSGGGWSFGKIRDVNYFLKNYKNIEDSFDTYKQYVGEAHFFRAFFYFDLVKDFGAVPYFTKPLGMDSEELYAPSTPRQQVIDSIIVDLNKAIEYMASGPNQGGTRLNKEIAQLFKSRVSLYEGTWEKYHDGTVFGVSDPKNQKYLSMAADAAEAVINSGHYSLYSTEDPEHDYFNLFNQLDYSEHPEIMLWMKYDEGQNMSHRQQKFVSAEWGIGGLTKSFVEGYLCTDGKPIAISPLYKGDATLSKIEVNRDPRLDQTIWGPGEPTAILGSDTLDVWKQAPLITDHPNIGGYDIKKGYQPDQSMYISPGTFRSAVSDHLFRYAEALLNYAEAKAELRTITQKDIDFTINELRDRVGMPHLKMNNIQNDPNWLYPDLSPLLNEVRRERRVELALEGFRWDDLARWRAHEVFVGERPLGAPFEPERYPDIVVGDDVYVNDEGYFDPYQKSLPGGAYSFDPQRDYLNPIPTQQLTLNENLEQNPGWSN